MGSSFAEDGLVVVLVQGRDKAVPLLRAELLQLILVIESCMLNLKNIFCASEVLEAPRKQWFATVFCRNL